MADNTVLNVGSGGDTIRDVAKSATSAKTQVVLIDIGGGGDGSPEFIDGVHSVYAAWGGTTNAAITNTIIYPKTSAGVFLGGLFYNSGTTIAYIQILNLASGGTLGTTVPIHVIPVLQGQIWNEPRRNIYLSGGVALAVTATATGSGAPNAAMVGSVFYY